MTKPHAPAADPPVPPPAVNPVEARYLVLKAERDALLIRSHDQLNREEAALAPYLALIQKHQARKALLANEIAGYNGTLETLYDLLDPEAQARVRPPAPAAPPPPENGRTAPGGGNGRTEHS